MMGRISPAPRFSRTSEPSRASWRAFSAPSRGPRFGRHSRVGPIVACMRSARLRPSHSRPGARPSWTCNRRSTRVYQSILARLERPFVPNRSIRDTTPCGANIATGSHPAVVSPFLGRYAWIRRTQLDAEAVAAGAQELVGTHDFASFAGGGEGVPWSARAATPKGTTRTILRCDCREVHPPIGPGSDQHAAVLEVRVVADGFLPHMVRNLVGALLQIGQGQRDPELDQRAPGPAGPTVRPGCGAAPGTYALASWLRRRRARRRLNVRLRAMTKEH